MTHSLHECIDPLFEPLSVQRLACTKRVAGLEKEIPCQADKEIGGFRVFLRLVCSVASDGQRGHKRSYCALLFLR